MTGLEKGSLTLTPEELVAIGGLFDVAGYPGMVMDDATPDELDALSGAGARSLLARGLVTIDAAAVTVTPTAALAPAVAPLVPPVAGAVVQQLDPEGSCIEIWWLGVDVVTRQSSDEMGLTTFTTMDPEEGHGLLAAWLHADERVAPSGDAFEVTWQDLMSVFADLFGEGAPSGDGGAVDERLVALRTQTERVNRVDLLWHPEADRREIASVTWIDCGEHGCWLVEPTEVGDGGEPDRFQIAPVSPREAFDLVTSGIPDLDARREDADPA